jgi:hypothetical protein
VDISGNVERVQDASELDQWDVPDRVKVIMAQGSHPEYPKSGDDSRSAWLFDFCCQMIRCEVPDAVIYAIITDGEWGISASVVDKGGSAEKYAIRQIEKAKEFTIDPWLSKMNQRHAIIGNMGGKCRVIEEVMDYALDRTRLTRQSFEDLRGRYMNKQVQVGTDAEGRPKFRPLGKWWLEHPKRREFESLVFVPGREITGAYNMWKGFACEALPGDCDLFLEHVRRNVCGDDERLHAYLLSWMARTVQRPATPGEVAIVLRGGRGVGKSFFAREVGKLFGRHFLHVSNPAHLVGNFNSHLRDVVVLFADEAFYANDKKHASILKTLITEETITIEAKGVDAEAAPNYIHLIMASNDMHVIPAGGDERRFFVLDVGTERQQDSDYFASISRQMNEGGREALLHMLLKRSLDDFQVRDVPATTALREQKLLSLDVEFEWWYNKLSEGRVLQGDNAWSTEVMKDRLVGDFIANAQRFNVSRRGSQTSLGRFLKKVCPRLRTTQRMAQVEIPIENGWSRKVDRRCYFYGLPDLEACRARWEELHGAEDWPEYQPELPGADDPPF